MAVAADGGGGGAAMRRLVIKFGGETVDGPGLDHLGADLRRLCEAGHRVSLVHGGGRQLTELSERLGLKTEFVGGRRITDAATLDALKMAVAGKLSVDLCAWLFAAGVRAVGLTGASAGVIRARRRPPRVIRGSGRPGPVDLGLVGDITGFDLHLIDALQAAGYVPTLAPLCVDDAAAGQIYNINADTLASELAMASSADQLLLVSNVPGVLADAQDPTTRFPRLTRAEAQAAIADGRVGGGMIPKLEGAFAALDRGVGAVQILGQLGPGDLFSAVVSPGAVGTALVP